MVSFLVGALRVGVSIKVVLYCHDSFSWFVFLLLPSNIQCSNKGSYQRGRELNERRSDEETTSVNDSISGGDREPRNVGCL